MSKAAALVRLAVFLLPAGPAKNRLLRRLGVVVGDAVSIGPTVSWGVGEFVIGDGARIGLLNVFRGLGRVEIGAAAIVGQFNWVSSPPEYSMRGGSHGTFTMRHHATLVSRHHVDCSGGVLLEEYCLVAGMHTLFISHQVNRRIARLEAAPIRVGAYSLVNAGNRLVPGATLPARCVTGMSAVILPGLVDEGVLYAGVPARAKAPVDTEGEFFHRVEADFGLSDQIGDAA